MAMATAPPCLTDRLQTRAFSASSSRAIYTISDLIFVDLLLVRRRLAPPIAELTLDSALTLRRRRHSRKAQGEATAAEANALFPVKEGRGECFFSLFFPPFSPNGGNERNVPK